MPNDVVDGNQNWFRYKFGAVRHQTIIRTSDDQDLRRHVPSLGHNEFMHDISAPLIKQVHFHLFQHSQYNCCWCTCSLRPEDISAPEIHDVELVTISSYMTKDIIYLCHISVEEKYKM